MKSILLGVTLMVVSVLQAFQAFSFPAPDAGRRILPSAACFLLDGQVHRLSRNGETLNRVTEEALPVEFFDVSPSTGDIVFVAGNSLVLLEAGGERRVLLEGEPLPPTGSGVAPFNDLARITGRIASPRYSPDGSTVAFIHNGLMTVNPLDGAVTVLHPNGDPFSSSDCRVINGIDSWSPDGGLILVTCYDYPLESVYGVSTALKELGGSLTVLLEGQGNSAWSTDGQSLFIGFPTVGGQQSFCRLEAPDWNCTMIGEEVPARSYFFYGYPCVAQDGGVYVFIAGGADPMTTDGIYSLYRVDSRGEGPNIVRLDSYTLREALWAGNGSGVLLVKGDGGLVWVPANEGAASLLPVNSVSGLRWDPRGN
ncbi:MAG: hypothetical protein R6V62_09965 [Candidatus Fermentibacteraceae bacterium]